MRKYRRICPSWMEHESVWGETPKCLTFILFFMLLTGSFRSMFSSVIRFVEIDACAPLLIHATSSYIRSARNRKWGLIAKWRFVSRRFNLFARDSCFSRDRDSFRRLFLWVVFTSRVSGFNCFSNGLTAKAPIFVLYALLSSLSFSIAGVPMERVSSLMDLPATKSG